MCINCRYIGILDKHTYSIVMNHWISKERIRKRYGQIAKTFSRTLNSKFFLDCYSWRRRFLLGFFPDWRPSKLALFQAGSWDDADSEIAACSFSASSPSVSLIIFGWAFLLFSGPIYLVFFSSPLIFPPLLWIFIVLLLICFSFNLFSSFFIYPLLLCIRSVLIYRYISGSYFHVSSFHSWPLSVASKN